MIKRLTSLLFLLGAAACGGSSNNSDPQTPPTSSEAAINAWLDEGHYKTWHCQTTTHASDPASAHPEKARICSNDTLSAHGDGEYPVGASNVKEVFDANDTQIATALYLKTKAGGGESFFWFGKGELVAFGPGSNTTVKQTCTDCHSDAGIGTPLGHDFVFTQVK